MNNLNNKYHQTFKGNKAKNRWNLRSLSKNSLTFKALKNNKDKIHHNSVIKIDKMVGK
jgi:hypothetical protein